MVSSFGHWPDFLTPTCGEVTPESAVGDVLATSPDRVRTELLAAGGSGGLAAALADDDGPALDQLGEAVLSYFNIGLAPYWLRIHAAADGTRATMARTLIDGGIERMLVGLWPGANWRPPVLELPYSCDRDLVPAGREVVLLPSFFSSHTPVTRQNPALPPVLVFSVRGACNGDTLRPPDASRARPAADAKLAALLGRTRAAVLESAGASCTTSELARRVGISLASASQHATVLREAGLITTVRHRNAVVHTTTPLGEALINHP